MKLEIENVAIWKFPRKEIKDHYWMWFSEASESIFFSIEPKVTIYSKSNNEWREIYLEDVGESEGVEALTATDKYLIFGCFGNDFEVYDLATLNHLKTLNIENSGYGAASYQNNVFLNNHEPGGIGMIMIPEGNVIKVFPLENILPEEDYLINSISYKEGLIVGFCEYIGLGEKSDDGVEMTNCFITWNINDGTFVSKINAEIDMYEDPMISEKDLLVARDCIYDLRTGDLLLELNLDEEESILTALHDRFFILNWNNKKDIKIYNMKSKELYQSIDLQADEIYEFKNTPNYLLGAKDDFFYLISLERMLKKIG
jgi:hypothetical protein